MSLLRMNNLNNLTMTNILRNSPHLITILTIQVAAIIPVVIILTIQVCIRLHIQIMTDGIDLQASLIMSEHSVQREVFNHAHSQRVLHQERDQL